MKNFRRDFEVVEVIEGPRFWADHVNECFAARGIRVRTAASRLSQVDWNHFNLHDYLFTHCTIVASVCHDKHDAHTITEGSTSFVNTNNNAWLNEVLGPPTNIYGSFVGSDNFYEHVQVPYLSKGKVLDAVLRKAKNETGEDIYVVDILVATDRRHRDLVARIEKKNLSTLSMGCIANVTQCSKCGKLVHNEWEECDHLQRELGQQYKTKYGYTSRVAELCGQEGNSQSCKFIEASWVEAPAFKGAVVNYFIGLPVDRRASGNVIYLADHAIDLLQPTAEDVELLAHVRVANKAGMLSLRLLVEGLRAGREDQRRLKIVRSLMDEGR